MTFRCPGCGALLAVEPDVLQLEAAKNGTAECGTCHGSFPASVWLDPPAPKAVKEEPADWTDRQLLAFINRRRRADGKLEVELSEADKEATDEEVAAELNARRADRGLPPLDAFAVVEEPVHPLAVNPEPTVPIATPFIFGQQPEIGAQAATEFDSVDVDQPMPPRISAQVPESTPKSKK